MERYEVYADAISASSTPFEAHNIEKYRHAVTAADVFDETKSLMMTADKILPFMSEVYNISANIKDYLLVPIGIIPTDLPNRNQVAFPFSELSKFDPEIGCIAYQTFKYKPTHIDHKNKDHTIAKGVIFETAMRPIHGVVGNLWKVITLAGFDRSRDPKLANDILSRNRTHYSMGAWTAGFKCSICGAAHPKGGCEHVQLGKPQYREYNGQLAYLMGHGIIGFEVSSVATPAWLSATNNNVMELTS